MSDNLVSIIIPVYRPKLDYLQAAIESLLHQTYKNIEIIIVEDAPDGSCEGLLKKIEDERILYIGNKERLGIAKSLNEGIARSHGKYIARMDADDYALKNRIQVQFDFMEKYKEIAVCGSWSMDVRNGKIIYMDPISNERRKVKQLFVNEGLLHPTVFFRKEFLQKYNILYNEKYKMAEDYELWVNCCKKGIIATIPRVLLLYRIHDGQVTISGHKEEKGYINNVKLEQLKGFRNLSEEERTGMLGYDTTSQYSSVYLSRIAKKILNENKRSKIYKQSLLEGELGWRWIKRNIRMNRFQRNKANMLYRAFFKSPFRLHIQMYYICCVLFTRILAQFMICKYRNTEEYRNAVKEAAIIG